MGELPDSLELVPGEDEAGTFDGSLEKTSAPILNLKWSDLIDGEMMLRMREVFAYWVQMDRDNCDLVRQSLLRFRTTTKYRSNEIPKKDLFELGLAWAEPQHLKRSIQCLAEQVECIGGQLGRRGERLVALEAALLLDQLQRSHAEAFENDIRFRHRLPGLLGMIVNNGINEALGSPSHLYAGVEAAERVLTNDPVIQKYLRQQTRGASS